MTDRIKTEICKNGYRARVFVESYPLSVLAHFYYEEIKPGKFKFHYSSNSQSVLENVVEKTEVKECTKEKADETCLKRIEESIDKLLENMGINADHITFERFDKSQSLKSNLNK